MVGSPRLRVHEGVMGCGGVVVCHRNARVRGVRGRSVGVYAYVILFLGPDAADSRGRPRTRCLHRDRRMHRRPRSTGARWRRWRLLVGWEGMHDSWWEPHHWRVWRARARGMRHHTTRKLAIELQSFRATEAIKN